MPTENKRSAVMRPLRTTAAFAPRLCLPWIGLLVLAGVFFLTLRQLILVLLIFIPVLGLYCRERMHRMAMVGDLKHVEAGMAGLLRSLSEGVLLLDERGVVTAVNPPAENILADEADALMHRPFDAIVPPDPDTIEAGRPQHLIEQCLEKGAPAEVAEMFLLAGSGVKVPVALGMTPVVAGETVIGAVVVFQELSEKKALQNKLKMVATLDPVTGVRNRWETERQLAIEMERARRHQRPLCILMMDIDHFKRINNTYGPHNGDTVLRAVCGALTGMMRSSDTLGRYGSEAFLAILPETGMDNAMVLAERLRETIAASAMPLDDRSVYLTISIGTAAYPGCGDTADALIQAADLALYKAKISGRNRVKAGRSTQISAGPPT